MGRGWSKVRFVAPVALVAVVAGLLSGGGAAQADVTVGTAGLFVPVQGRLVASATGTGTAKAPFAAYTPRAVQVTGQAGIPDDGVSAVLVTITATNPKSAGQVSAGPADGALSGVMRYDAGAGTSNSAIVSLSGSGQIQLQTTTVTDVTADVQGYYTAGNGVTAAGGYASVTDARIVDTVNGVGLPKATLASGSTSTIQVAGKAGVPDGARAVFVNFQVDNTTTAGGSINPYATSATSRPGVALSFDSSPFTSIGAVVPVDGNGQIHLFLSAGNTINLLMDVEGYFTDSDHSDSGDSDNTTSGAGVFTPAVGKIYDTRTATHVAPGATVTVPVGGTNGIPTISDGLSAATVNLTVIDAGTAGGYARAWPSGTTEPTNVGTVTFDKAAAGTVTTNLATVPVGAENTIQIHNVSPDTVDYIIDLEGWYSASAPAVSCPAPYGNLSWTTAIPAAPITCTISAPSATNETLTYSVDGGDVATIPLSPSSRTTASVPVDAVGGEHDITATRTDANGNNLTTVYKLSLGDWTKSTLAGVPADGGTAATEPVLAVSTAAGDPNALPNGAAREYTISASTDLSNPLVVSDPLANGFTVPQGLLSAGVTYYWRAQITGATDYAGRTTTIMSPVWSFTTNADVTEQDPTAGNDTPVGDATADYLGDFSTDTGPQTLGVQYGDCTLQVPYPHPRKSGAYGTVGVKPITDCPRSAGKVSVSNSTSMYHTWVIWLLGKGGAFAGNGTTSGKNPNEYIQTNTEIPCNGARSTWWIGQTVSTVIEHGKKYYARAYSAHKQLPCGA